MKLATFIRPRIISITFTENSTESHPHWNDEIQENDCGTDQEDGDGVANVLKAPIKAARIWLRSLHNGCDRNDVVEVRGMAQPEKIPPRGWERKPMIHFA